MGIARFVGRHWRKVLILPPLAAGVFAVAWMVRHRPSAARTEQLPPPRTVRTIVLAPVPVVPRAVGYGLAEPARTWQAVAQVGARVVELHPDLERGALLPAGAVVVRLDDTELSLAVARIEARIAALNAQRRLLAVGTANNQASLAIEQQLRQLRGNELERQRKLRQEGVGKETDVEQAEAAALAQEAKVQALRNSLSLAPSQQEVLTAELAQAAAELADARARLAYTTFALPFDCRIADTAVEVTEFVPAGRTMVTAVGIDRAEIPAHFPIDAFRRIVSGDANPLAPESMDTTDIGAALGVGPALVRFSTGEFSATWEGRFVRVAEALDPRTRTVTAVIAVDDPFANVQPGVRPPLIPGMYCEVVLRGPVMPDQLVIPASALDGDTVCLLDADGRLARRTIVVGHRQDDWVAIAAGLAAGDRVIVSDIAPAIDGLRLHGVDDPALAARLAAAAVGEEAGP